MTDPDHLAKLAWLSVLLPGHAKVLERAGVELATGSDLATLLDNFRRLGGVASDPVTLLLSVVESAVLNAGIYADQEQIEDLARSIVAQAENRA